MRKSNFAKLGYGFLLVLLIASFAVAQKKRPSKNQKVKPQEIVFAVLDDGKTLEPIGVIDKGTLEPATGGDAEVKDLNAFVKSYYTPKTTYRLIFGAADAGTVTVVSSNPKSDCAKNMATVTTQSAKSKLKGMVMGLATNGTADNTASGTRRLPTAAERAEIETLVRNEFTKNNVTAKDLKYQNLTALDVDNDKKAELVGSFWVETSTTSRALLFFIADKGANGKYSFGYSDFKAVKQDELMSGSEINSIDDGIYHELLLDALEYDGDTTAEIFTYSPSFEGSNFKAYSRRDGKWTKVFEGSNYHCAF